MSREKNQTPNKAQEEDSYAAAVDALGLKKEDLEMVDFLPDAELKAQLDELKTEADKSRDKMLRAMAEMDNMRRIAQRDIANAHRYGSEKMVIELLPVLDSFEQGLASRQDNEGVKAILDGMELTHRMLLTVLEKFGVKILNPVGQVFDPHQHEAMMAQESADAAPNTVLVVVQKGYQLHDRVIRPARVIVAKSSAS